MGKENDKCACVTKLFICSLKDRTAKNLQNAHATEFLLLFAPVLVVQSCNAHMPATRNIPGFGPYVPRRCIDTGVEVGVAGDLTLWIFKIAARKGCLVLVFVGNNKISSCWYTLEKFWKNTLVAPLGMPMLGSYGTKS